MTLTQERLRELLDYNPLTGVFTWRVQRRGVTRGAVAGVVMSKDGYRRIQIDGHRYGANRLVWLYVHGRWPVKHIDHKNRIVDDNRLCNLREATNAENMRNAKRPCTNTSGYKGVSWVARTGRWWARIKVNGSLINLGRFTTAELAHAAYCAAALQHHGEFARLT